MNDAAAIIRLCYAPGYDEVEVGWRFAFFEREVLPRLVAQTHPTDIRVWVHPRHREEIERMGVGTFTVREEEPVHFYGTMLKGYPWDKVHGLAAYRYQALLGSDDLLAPTFIEASITAMEGRVNALVSHQPIMLDWASGRCYRMKRLPRPSPLVVLKQDPLDTRYTWVWAHDHRHLGAVVDSIVWMDEGLGIMTVHPYNDGTRLSIARQPEIGRPTWL